MGMPCSFSKLGSGRYFKGGVQQWTPPFSVGKPPGILPVYTPNRPHYHAAGIAPGVLPARALLLPTHRPLKPLSI